MRWWSWRSMAHREESVALPSRVKFTKLCNARSNFREPARTWRPKTNVRLLFQGKTIPARSSDALRCARSDADRSRVHLQRLDGLGSTQRALVEASDILPARRGPGGCFLCI